MKYLAIALFGALVACSDKPTSTGTPCPDPDPNDLAYTSADDPTCTGGDCNFGKTFMDAYCISCHDSALSRPERHGAPLYHDFDTLLGVMKVPVHIDQQAGIGPNAANHFMPPDDCPSTPGGALDIKCPQPTDEEREKLAKWIACEVDRPHSF